MDQTIAILASETYLPHLKVCIDAIRKYNKLIHINVMYFGKREDINGYTGSLFVTSATDNGREPIGKQIYAARPHFMLQLLNSGYTQVLHIGADVIFYSNPEQVFLDYQNSNVALSPHITSPPENLGSVVQVHRVGLFNSDFVLWNDSVDTRRFLEWQKTSMQSFNEDRPDLGLFFDQTYLTFAAFFIENAVHIGREHNVAYFNLHEKRRKIKSFQFTGFNPQMPTEVSKFMHPAQKKFLTSEVIKITLEYQANLEKAGLQCNLEDER